MTSDWLRCSCLNCPDSLKRDSCLNCPDKWEDHFSLSSIAGTLKSGKVVHLYSALITNVSRALYNDQFTPRGLEAHTGANCSRF